jgi:hypothetical protein
MTGERIVATGDTNRDGRLAASFAIRRTEWTVQILEKLDAVSQFRISGLGDETTETENWL